MALSEKQKMRAGLPYHAGDAELRAEQAASAAWLARYNAALARPVAEWRANRPPPEPQARQYSDRFSSESRDRERCLDPPQPPS